MHLGFKSQELSIITIISAVDLDTIREVRGQQQRNKQSIAKGTSR